MDVRAQFLPWWSAFSVPEHDGTVIGRLRFRRARGQRRQTTMAKTALEHPLFKNDIRLQNCLRFDKDHVQFGEVGDFVFKIQLALITIDHLSIDPEELKKTAFLTTTRDAVRKYKE